MRWGPTTEPFGSVPLQLGVAIGSVGLITVLARGLEDWLHLPGVAMLFFLGVVLCAYGSGVFASGLSALLSVGAFNYFFVEPRHSLLVDATESWLTLAGLLCLSALVSSLTLRLQMATRRAQWQQAQSDQARDLLEALMGLDSRQAMLAVAAQRVGQWLKGSVSLWVAQSPSMSLAAEYGHAFDVNPQVLNGVLAQGAMVGWATEHASDAPYVCVPVETSPAHACVLCFLPEPEEGTSLVPAERLDSLRMQCQQLRLALQRERALRDAQDAWTAKEQESLRNTFLTSVAHDLRTPLASILAAATALKSDQLALGSTQAPRLLEAIGSEVRQMAKITDNVLTMVRLTEAHESPLRADWESLEEIIGDVVSRHRQRDFMDGPVVIQTHVPADLPLVWVDGPLISQWLDNVLDNAARHAPRQVVDIGVRVLGDRWALDVEDHGPGFSDALPGLLTARFHRGDDVGDRRGFGLGLTICQAIAQAHGAELCLSGRLDGQSGARASLILAFPIQPQEPQTLLEATP
jgi:two-component system, OmpR family, sensor histidine kinase KdpD